ncbi:hypothetical protein BCL93_112108 [Onishia taeanensis]|uniref:Uncharacterized protein n=1 Tax=Onishia taeanensis TaxID=284577 RepID=A0A328XJB8_9GAMM|nr:hypothetical protein BCL93_112108 [Halomonas taeanensis]
MAITATVIISSISVKPDCVFIFANRVTRIPTLPKRHVPHPSMSQYGLPRHT